MLKKIKIDRVRIGMHVHAMEGAWSAHPFWKTRFSVRDADQLTQLRESAIQEVWIDTEKGIDDLPQAAAIATQAIRVDNLALPQLPSRPAASRSFEDELSRAAGICSRGKAQVEKLFDEARLGNAIDAEACMPLVHEVTESVFRNPGALVSLTRLKGRDDYSYMHSVAVCALMVSLARETGLDDQECWIAGMAGLLHDVGKALMPVEILLKPGKLTDEEFDVMKRHPECGHEILREANGADATALDVCLHHHERIDGTGYPNGLVDQQISSFARMGAICDVYDAITSDRPYKRGWDPGESIAKMMSWQGHFDPDLLAKFVKCVGIYPIGSLVKLQSERLAVVIDQNPQTLTAPVVRVFFSLRSQMPIPPERLDLSRGSHDRIVGRESPEHWKFPYLDDLWDGTIARGSSRRVLSR